MAACLGHGGDGGVDLGRRECQRLLGQLQPVEAARQLDHRFGTARLHIGDDFRDHRVDIDAGLALGLQQRFETGLEIRLVVAQGDGHWRLPGGGNPALFTRGAESRQPARFLLDSSGIGRVYWRGAAG